MYAHNLNQQSRPKRRDFFCAKMKKTKVSIQGIQGSFHAQAAQKFFGNNIQLVECQSFKSTCCAIHTDEADYAIMAIENSIAGSLLPNYGLIQEFNLSIVGEVNLPIQLHLMGLPGVRFNDIKYVQSHPVAIRQCLDFFEEYPDKQVLEKNDTAACAKEIADKQLTDTFAIAGSMAAEIFGLEIKERRIEKSSKNYTRFLILSKNSTPIEKAPNKGSACFHVSNRIGSLSEVLSTFAQHEINLTKIQSTPVIGFPEKDNFFIDFVWKSYDQYEQALSKIIRQTSNLSLLGEYKQQDLPINI